jgi:hypothetical protein
MSAASALGQTYDPLTKRYIGKNFIREKGRCLGHAAGSTAGTAISEVLDREHPDAGLVLHFLSLDLGQPAEHSSLVDYDMSGEGSDWPGILTRGCSSLARQLLKDIKAPRMALTCLAFGRWQRSTPRLMGPRSIEPTQCLTVTLTSIICSNRR